MKVEFLIVVALAAALPAWTQAAKTATTVPGAREYFFLAAQKKDALPPLKRASQRKVKAPAASSSPAGAAVPHLGLRYTLLLVDRASGKVRAVDPDHNFRVGDCVAMRLDSNRSGYLYVLAMQSSGAWFPLLPSPQMTSESNVINPGEPLQIPKDFCFAIQNPPGEEKLFVMLSRDPSAISDLNNDVRKPAAPAASPAPEQNAKPTSSDFPGEKMELADARSLNQDVAELSQRYQTRDLMIVRVGPEKTAKAEEAARSVYVVNASSQRTSNLIAQIVIRHR